ncbi:MAG: ribose 5-phosphate isomerase A [Candidatus Bathyarchaeia archaeon]
MSWIEGAKRNAVLKAIEPVKNGWVIGLGSGSTLAYAVRELARLQRDRKMEFSVVPTSYQMEYLAASHGLRVTSLNEVARVDYAIDGADQVRDGSLDLVKGGGGALLREKIVDSSARSFVVVVDQLKVVEYLGGKQLIPLEILPFAYRYVRSEVAKMGGKAKVRESSGKMGPVITDNGNFLVDVDFGRVESPSRLERGLKAIPGVLETGLFVRMVDRVFVGQRNGKVRVMNPR